MHGVISDRVKLSDRVAIRQRSGQEPNPFVSPLDQVVDGIPRCADIVDQHRVGGQAPNRTVNLHDRKPVRQDRFEMPGLIQLSGSEQNAIDSPLQQRLDGTALESRILFAVGDDHVVALCPGDVGEPPHGLAKERVRHIRADEAERQRAAGDHALSQTVRLVAESIGVLPDDRPCFIAHPAVAPQRPGSGSPRDAGRRRDVFDRRPPRGRLRVRSHGCTLHPPDQMALDVVCCRLDSAVGAALATSQLTNRAADLRKHLPCTRGGS
jgi:hypothetical protein